MKKLLPAANNRKGFTLVELLIVIAIIAVLAAVATAVYGNFQRDARNARRREDLDAIAKALELNRTATGYIALAATQFASNAIPATDPSTYPYCANSTASTQPADPAAWTTACPATNYGAVGTTNPPAGTAWKICTSGESTMGVVCKLSAQQ